MIGEKSRTEQSDPELTCEMNNRMKVLVDSRVSKIILKMNQ